MQTSTPPTPPPAPPRGTIRLTRRGRTVLIVTGAVVAATAVAVPLLSTDDRKEPRALVIPEGWRSGQVYEAMDKALALPAGTSRKSLRKAHLELPGDASGNPEGYLFPAAYPLDGRSTPTALLSYMVETANRKFAGGAVTAGAERNATNTYRTVTVASIVQAEAATEADMGRVARVIYNRLDRGVPLQMDSTLDYALNRSTSRTRAGRDDIRLESPYNTYTRMGLPPTPIANPGEKAMRAAVAPPQGDWLYFVTVKRGDTRFTADQEEHRRNLAESGRAARSAAPSAG